MGHSNLTPEIWSMIFSFCMEPSHQDKQISQPTLVKLLRVSSTFFLIAGRLLYRDVVIGNLGGLLLGINKTELPDERKNTEHLSDLKLIRVGNTKLPLIRCIRNITVTPYSSEDEVNNISEIILDQQICYIQVKSILKVLSNGSFNVDVQSLTIGSGSAPKSKEIERIQSRFFCEIHSIRRKLLELFKPEVWTEYSPLHGYCFEPLQSDFTNVKRILPEVVNIYTTLEGTFPLVWGTLNRTIVRRKENRPVQGMPDMSVLMVNPETIPEELDMISYPRFNEKTKIEIYGLEKLIAVSNPIDGEHDPDDRKEESEMRTLARVENRIREGSNVTSEGRWIRSGKKAFSIGLSLDVDDQDQSGNDESSG
ncbi:hypothetical protein I203_100239 [Kwoniella mangroviensis CBS 8507]|uniref:uncharacterized protein n=1 Tax=Kwoniella mangroviensis CBS 8507 TaxID=1296122 RepID=UPI00080D1648|nr:uncharacterized protein I203_05889 [Kwoniella mangroviensis CBS 8507]OCF65147.1 hypothetical protein I203_05889 [Kwoniella mangroviensis CBS 8507]